MRAIFHENHVNPVYRPINAKLVYLNFAQISDDMIEWPESKEQLLSQYCASSYRAKSAKTLKADLDYAVSIVSLIWAKFR